MADLLDFFALGTVSAERGVNLVTITEPQPPPSIWPAVAVGAVLLLAAALFAHRRARRPDRTPPGRLARILWSALACGGGVTLVMAPEGIMGNMFGSSLEVTAALGLKFLGWTILAALLFGSADLMLDGFRPRRSLAWLCIGPLLLTVYGVGFLAASDWFDGFDSGAAGPTPLAAILGASLIWWSFLPVVPERQAHGDVAAIFE